MANDNQKTLPRRTVKRRALAGAVVAAAYTTPAFAYLDPGTGSIILQGLLAGIAAVVAAGSMFWHRIKTTFSSLFPRKKSPVTEASQASED